MIPKELWQAYLKGDDTLVKPAIADWLEEHGHYLHAWVWRIGRRASSYTRLYRYKADCADPYIGTERDMRYLGVGPPMKKPRGGDPTFRWYRTAFQSDAAGTALAILRGMCRRPHLPLGGVRIDSKGTQWVVWLADQSKFLTTGCDAAGHPKYAVYGYEDVFKGG